VAGSALVARAGRVRLPYPAAQPQEPGEGQGGQEACRAQNCARSGRYGATTMR